MNIILESKPLIITAIKKKTQAKMLKDLILGDIIKLSVEAKRVGSNRGTYATYIQVENIANGETTEFSFNQISILYNAFELAEC